MIIGLIDNSLSMFLGNLITLFMSMIQLSQKYYSSCDLIN